ncbi:hypothetical protein ACPPVQ_15670 [Diaminobutyricibacter sp. McL0618]|uniref:hypothetical protein n=1 Tax=Leifsonia sp. McL0618 TaxID=3415677 RepID=UPI003CEFC34A
MTVSDLPAGSSGRFRLKPPSGIGTFGRRVWWAGQVLWFVSPLMLVAGIVSINARIDVIVEPTTDIGIWLAGLGVTFVGAGFLLRYFSRTTWAASGSSPARVRRLVLYVSAIGVAIAVNSFFLGYAVLVVISLVRALLDPSGWTTD